MQDGQKRLAEEIAEGIKNGKVTKETAKKFAELMGPEALKELASGLTDFGNVALPDDDW